MSTDWEECSCSSFDRWEICNLLFLQVKDGLVPFQFRAAYTPGYSDHTITAVQDDGFSSNQELGYGSLPGVLLSVPTEGPRLADLPQGHSKRGLFGRTYRETVTQIVSTPDGLHVQKSLPGKVKTPQSQAFSATNLRKAIWNKAANSQSSVPTFLRGFLNSPLPIHRPTGWVVF